MFLLFIVSWLDCYSWCEIHMVGLASYACEFFVIHCNTFGASFDQFCDLTYLQHYEC